MQPYKYHSNIPGGIEKIQKNSIFMYTPSHLIQKSISPQEVLIFQLAMI